MNLKVRFKNPIFLLQLALAFLTPILTYAGLTLQDLTSWKSLWELLISAFHNPYVCSLILISVWNAINDPTTSGLLDSPDARSYTTPKK